MNGSKLEIQYLKVNFNCSCKLKSLKKSVYGFKLYTKKNMSLKNMK